MDPLNELVMDPRCLQMTGYVYIVQCMLTDEAELSHSAVNGATSTTSGEQRQRGDDNDVPTFDIPIFTEEFLDHNKSLYHRPTIATFINIYLCIISDSDFWILRCVLEFP